MTFPDPRQPEQLTIVVIYSNTMLSMDLEANSSAKASFFQNPPPHNGTSAEEGRKH